MIVNIEKKQSFITNFIYFLIIAAVIYALVKFCLPLLLPFVLAFVVAALMRRPTHFLRRKLNISVRICGLITAVLFFVIVACLVYLGGGGVVSGIQALLVNLPEFFNKTVEPMVMNTFNDLETMKIWNDMNLTDLLADLETQIMDALAGLAATVSTKAVAMISGFATSLPGLFIRLVLFIIGTVFISMDYDRLMGFCIDQMNERTKTLFFEIKAYIVGTLLVVIRSYILIMSITFIELSIGLTIIGINNSILVALCIAIFDILPVLGTGGVMIPWTVISVILGDFRLAVSLLVVYVIVTIIRNIIEPKIVGGQLGLHPIVTLSSMFAGVQLLGAAGLFGFPIGLSLICHLDRKGVITVFKKKEAEVPEEEALEEPSGADADIDTEAEAETE